MNLSLLDRHSRGQRMMYSANRAARALGAAFLAGLLATLGLTALLYAMQWLPPEPIIGHIRSSFGNGSLQDHDWLCPNDRIGFDQWSDCIVMQMFLFRRDAWPDTVAPTVVFNDWPIRLSGDSGKLVNECEIARSAAFSAGPFDLYPAESYFRYSRYIHAFRLPAYFLLEKFDMRVIRRLYRVMVYGALLILLFTHVVLTIRRLRSLQNGRGEAAHLLV